MPPRPTSQPTEAELELLQILWRRGPSTVREVHEDLQGGRGTAYTTTLKIMQIMLEKRLVSRDDSERSHRYTAAAEPEETRRSMVKAFMDRVFGGSAADMVLSALGSSKATAKELSQIKALIHEAERGRKKK